MAKKRKRIQAAYSPLNPAHEALLEQLAQAEAEAKKGGLGMTPGFLGHAELAESLGNALRGVEVQRTRGGNITSATKAGQKAAKALALEELLRRQGTLKPGQTLEDIGVPITGGGEEKTHELYEHPTKPEKSEKPQWTDQERIARFLEHHAATQLGGGLTKAHLATPLGRHVAAIQIAVNILDELTYHMGHAPRDERDQPGGLGWYTQGVEEHKDLLSKVMQARPSMRKAGHHRIAEKDDPRETLFDLVLAMTSNASDPERNMQAALQLYLNGAQQQEKGGKKSGNLDSPFAHIVPNQPLKTNWPVSHPNAKVWNGVEKQLGFLQAMVRHLGEEGAAQFLKDWHEEKEVSAKRGGGKLDEPHKHPTTGKVMGSSMIGPKTGRFFAAIQGILNQLVIDRWQTRSTGRQLGDLMQKKGGFDVAKEGPHPRVERPVAMDAYDMVQDVLGLAHSETQAPHWVFEQGIYDLLGSPTPSKTYVQGVHSAAGSVINHHLQQQGEKGLTAQELETLHAGVKERLQSKPRQGLSPGEHQAMTLTEAAGRQVLSRRMRESPTFFARLCRSLKILTLAIYVHRRQTGR